MRYIHAWCLYLIYDINMENQPPNMTKKTPKQTLPTKAKQAPRGKLKAPRTTLQKIGHARKVQMIYLVWKCGNITTRQIKDHILMRGNERSAMAIASAMLRKATAAGELILRTDEWGHTYYFLGMKGARFLIANGHPEIIARSGRKQNINQHRSISNTYALQNMRNLFHVATYTDADIWGHSFIDGGAKRIPWKSWEPFYQKKPDAISVFSFQEGTKILDAEWIEVENSRRSDKDLAKLITFVRQALLPAHSTILWHQGGFDVVLDRLIFVLSKSTALSLPARIERALLHPMPPRNKDGSIDRETPRARPLTTDEMERVAGQVGFINHATGVLVYGLPSFKPYWD